MPAVPAAIPPNEAQRLAALRRYGVLDTPAEQAFDDLAHLAAFICGTPISVVSLIDVDRQWFKSEIGLDTRETHRDVAFCAHAILDRDVFVVPDATADGRFVDNPLVTGDPNIRFYAGAPMITPDGFSLGTVCVIDRVPRELTDAQRDALKALSRQAMAQLELRRKQAETAAALAEAETLAALKGQFVSMVSHELRTPLTSIRGSLQLTLDGNTDAAETRELLGLALDSTERLIRLTNDILDLSKFEAGKMALRPEVVEARRLAEAAGHAVAHMPGAEGRVTITIGAGVDRVVADRDRIVQALVNLLANAIKFSRGGVSLSVSAERGGLAFAVTDHGDGMSADDVAALFQPFTQLSAGVRAGGTGLGLTITRLIVEQHGGTITVDSAPGRGSTFVIWLPATPTA